MIVWCRVRYLLVTEVTQNYESLRGHGGGELEEDVSVMGVAPLLIETRGTSHEPF